MTSDWKQSAIDRSDFRRSKIDPEIPKKRKNSRLKKKNKFKLVIKDFSFFSSQDKKDYILGKYTTKARAEQALFNQKHDLFFKTYDIKIEEI